MGLGSTFFTSYVSTCNVSNVPWDVKGWRIDTMVELGKGRF